MRFVKQKKSSIVPAALHGIFHHISKLSEGDINLGFPETSQYLSNYLLKCVCLSCNLVVIMSIRIKSSVFNVSLKKSV